MCGGTMATLSVWKFDSWDGAGEGLAMFKRLQMQQHVLVQDAAIVSWPDDARVPSITELHSLVGAGNLGGAFWGTVFGLLYLVPVLGLAIYAGVGGLIAT